MKTKLLTLALAALTIGLLGSCNKNNGPETPKLPEGALPGEFSVSATKKVHFSQGNLYYDGNAFKFETNQYDFFTPSDDWWSTNHISHFYWSKNASVTYAASYSDDDATDNDIFFTNETETTAKAGFTANGVTGQYRTLSKDEWVYLINKNGENENVRKGKYKLNVTVCGKTYCMILAPDDFTGTIADSYDTSAWATAEAAGLVCLPAAGLRDEPIVYDGGKVIAYWSSTPEDDEYAYSVYSDSYNGGLDADSNSNRSMGYSIRLVTDAK